jgi:succinyl-CoA synthetase alpha subunit
MAILVDGSTRVLVQGITGREGSFHTQQMQAYGTHVVAGVVPGRGGGETLGVPIFDTVAEAVARTGADTAFTIVPPAFAADAVMEAAAAGLRLGICVTEGIPVLDMVRATAFVARTAMRLIGPNCPGVMTPGQAKIGFIPNHVGRPGRVGVVARSGTLTYEVIQGLSESGATRCSGPPSSTSSPSSRTTPRRRPWCWSERSAGPTRSGPRSGSARPGSTGR